MTGRPESPKTLARVRTPIAGASLRGIAATGRRRIAPLTVAVLLCNTVLAAELRLGRR